MDRGRAGRRVAITGYSEGVPAHRQHVGKEAMVIEDLSGMLRVELEDGRSFFVASWYCRLLPETEGTG